jgi:acetolactate synthase I/III small subunit
MEKQYTLSVFCENKVGLISRVCIMFTRRKMNLESFTASETEIKNIYRFTIVVNSTREQLEKIALQLEKIIDVLRVLVHDEDDFIYQEVALYKVAAKALQSESLKQLVQDNRANILSTTPEYLVIEKTGRFEDTQLLFEKLEKYGIMEFGRSGRVVILKWSKRFHDHLKEFELTSIK